MESEDVLMLVSIVLLVLACFLIYNYQVEVHNKNLIINELNNSYLSEKAQNQHDDKISKELAETKLQLSNCNNENISMR